MRHAAAVQHYYPLGDSETEAARLQRQAALWDPITVKLLDRLNIQRGWRILEIGPGLGSIHLKLRSRARAPVDAVEPSSQFCSHLSHICLPDGFGEACYWNTPLLDASLPASTYDLIFARWVMLFVEKPELHINKLARALKPGGLLAIEDYGNREAFALIPRPPEWEDFLLADRAFFAARGGDVSIAGRLPLLYQGGGLEIAELIPTALSGGPASAVWQWLWEYFLSVRERYEAIPPLSPAKVGSLSESWENASRCPHARVFAPLMLDVVGVRR